MRATTCRERRSPSPVPAEEIDDDEPRIGSGPDPNSLGELAPARRLEDGFGLIIHTGNESGAAFASRAGRGQRPGAVRV